MIPEYLVYDEQTERLALAELSEALEVSKLKEKLRHDR